MTIGSDLHAAVNAVGAILHKLKSPSSIATAHQIADTQLGIRIQCSPRPSITPAFGLPFRAGILGFGSNKIPDFVALQTANAEVANVLVVVSGASLSQIEEQTGNGVAGNSRHAGCRADAIAFHQGRYNSRLLLPAQPVHIDHNA